MREILTVTLNPALDISTSVEKILPDEKLRCEAPVTDPGGGGTNVARAIHLLGGTARAFVAVSGFRGDQFVGLLREEGVEAVVFEIPGETRQSFAVIDRSDGRQYRFVMPGPVWNDEQAFIALERIGDVAPEGGLVVLSGSQPPGVPIHFASDLAAAVTLKGAKLVVDTSGAALRAVSQERGAPYHVLRLDSSETETLAGRKLEEPDEVADFAQSLVARGVAEAVVLALGAAGSVLAVGARRWHAVSAPVEARSKVGAGDSFLGAYTLSLARGGDHCEALRWGVAAASAAVMSDATTLCRKPDVLTLLPGVSLREI